tara:strand:- start:45 stop:668 length:624 start_codon:yes stop_codon:yes gene_type:complete
MANQTLAALKATNKDFNNVLDSFMNKSDLGFTGTNAGVNVNLGGVGGVMGNNLAKTAVGAGTFPVAPVINTHYFVTGTLTVSAPVLPAHTAGDVIIVEYLTTTINSLMVANGVAVVFTLPAGEVFDLYSYARWAAQPASNGGAVITNGWDADVSVAADDTLTLTGATAGGPGNGSKLVFTSNGTSWRVEADFYGAGAATAVPNVAFS